MVTYMYLTSEARGSVDGASSQSTPHEHDPFDISWHFVPIIRLVSEYPTLTASAVRKGCWGFHKKMLIRIVTFLDCSNGYGGLKRLVAHRPRLVYYVVYYPPSGELHKQLLGNRREI